MTAVGAFITGVGPAGGVTPAGRTQGATPLPAVAPAQARELATILGKQADAHEALAAVLVEQREAMRTADAAGMVSTVKRTHELTTLVESLELARRSSVRGLAGRDPDGVTVHEIAQRTPEPERGVLLGEATRLRSALENWRRASAPAREAAEAMSSHLGALTRQVARRLSETGTYAPPRPGAAGPIPAGIDITR